MPGVLVALLPIALLTGVLGCDDGPTGPETPAMVEAVAVSPSTATLLAGDTLRLTATARDASGGVIQNVRFTWTSGDTMIATVKAVGANVARATIRRAGSVRIDASAGGKAAEAVLAAENPAPAVSEMLPSGAPVGSGPVALTVRGSGFVPDAQILWNGSVLATTYASALELRATVPGSALEQEGRADVAVRSPAPGGGTSSSLEFTLYTRADTSTTGVVASVELNVDSAELVEGDTLRMTATPRDAEGRVVGGLAVLWTTESEEIAAISAGGRVSARRVGETRVTARVHGKEASATIRVSADLAADLMFDAFTGAGYALQRIDPRDADPEPSALALPTWALDPAISPDGSKVAYVVMDSISPRGIWVANIDGTDARRVSRWLGEDTQPAWSPDGTRLAFTRRIQGQGTDIWVTRLDSLIETNLTAGMGVTNQFSPAWSPVKVGGEHRIAFSWVANGQAHVWTMREDGSDPRQLTFGVVYDDEPAWAPDGSRLVFARIGDLYTVRPDGSDERFIVGLPYGQWAPAWSPDGRHIAFSSKDAESVYQIYTVFADGSGLARRTRGAGHKEHPVWVTR